MKKKNLQQILIDEDANAALESGIANPPSLWKSSIAVREDAVLSDQPKH